jgi:hypothetical protein
MLFGYVCKMGQEISPAYLILSNKLISINKCVCACFSLSLKHLQAKVASRLSTHGHKQC